MLHANLNHSRCAAVAIGTVALSTIMRAVIDIWLHEQIPYTTYYPAIIFTALCCGLPWGMASVGLSALAASFWLTPPDGHSSPNGATWPGCFSC